MQNYSISYDSVNQHQKVEKRMTSKEFELRRSKTTIVDHNYLKFYAPFFGEIGEKNPVTRIKTRI